MKRLLPILMMMALIPAQASASVNAGFDWTQENGEADRSLAVCFHRGLSIQWRDWAEKAIEIWNKESAETGWSLEVVPFTTDRCQIFLLLRDLDEDLYSGLELYPLDVLNGQKESYDGRVNAIIASIDQDLEVTKSWLKDGEDKMDGAFDGWSEDVTEGTRDPIDVMLHIFSHSFRLGHRERDTGIDEVISHHRLAGEHLHQLSSQDISLAKIASEDSWSADLFTVDEDGEFVEIDNVTLDVPEEAFGRFSYDERVVVLDTSDWSPIPLEVPNGYSHVYKSVGIFFDEQLQDSITVTLSYQDLDLVPSESALFGAEGYYAPGLREETIGVVRYEKKSWDLTPVVVEPNPSYWMEVGGIEVDEEMNTVMFEIDEPGYYGLVADPDPEQPSAYGGFTRIVDGKVLDEEELLRKLRTEEFIDSVLFQLPSFIVGLFGGMLLVMLWRQSKNRRKRRSDEQDPDIEVTTDLLRASVEGDRERVTDIQRIERIIVFDEHGRPINREGDS